MQSPIDRIKETYVQLRVCSGNFTEAEASNEVQALLAKLKAAGVRPLSAEGAIRRGAVYEYSSGTMFIKALLQDSHHTVVKLHPPEETWSTRSFEEMWRESESLVLQPHSFTALRQLPELQQIISHTAVAAVTACAGQMTHVKQLQAPIRQRQLLGNLAGHFRGASSNLAEVLAGTGGNLAGKAFTAIPDVVNDSRVFSKRQEDRADNSIKLFEHLSPAMRICLAADVAMGMLCPSQQAPPDTPEHAAALHMFVDLAFNQVNAQLQKYDPNKDSSFTYTKPAAVEQLWSAAPDLIQRQLSGNVSSANGPSSSSSSSSRMYGCRDRRQHQQQRKQQRRQQQQQQLCDWLLAPQLDLLMQLPAQQIIEMVLTTLDLDHHQQQQDGHHSKISSSTVAAGVEQQLQQLIRHLEPAALLLKSMRSAAAGAATADGSSIKECSSSNPKLQDMISSLLQSSSGSSNGIGVDSLLDGCGERQYAVGLGPQLQQHEEQWQPRHLEQQPQQQQQEPEGLAHVVMGEQGPSLVEAPWGSASDCDSSSSSSDDVQDDHIGTTSGSSSNKATADSPIEPFDNQQVQQIATLAECLVLQFMREHSAAAAAADSSSAAAALHRQDRLALDVLLLLAQVQQLKGFMSRKVPALSAETAAIADSRCNVCNSSSCSNVDHEGANGVTPDSTDVQKQQIQDKAQRMQAEWLRQQQQQCVQVLLGLLHTLRQFGACNGAAAGAPAVGSQAAGGSTAAAAAADGCIARPAGTVHSTDIGSKPAAAAAGALPPHKFFSASGPLAAGIRGELGPAAAAPTAAAVPSTAADGCSSCSNSFHMQAAAGSCNPQQQQQQQHDAMLSVFKGSLCWQQAMRDAQATVLDQLQANPDQITHQIIQKTLEQRVSDVWHGMYSSSSSSRSQSDLCYSAITLKRDLQHALGRPIGYDLVEHLVNLSKTAGGVIKGLRLEALEDLGYGQVQQAGRPSLGHEATGCSTVQSQQHERHQQQQQQEQQEGTASDKLIKRFRISERQVKEKISEIDSELMELLQDFSAEDSEDYESDDISSESIGDIECSSSSSSSSRSSDLADDDYQAPNAAAAATAAAVSHSAPAVDIGSTSGGSSSSSSRGHLNLQADLDKAHEAFRSLCDSMLELFKPLQLWHMQWAAGAQQQLQAAKDWWESKERKQLALELAAGKTEPLGVPSSSSGGGSGRWKPGQFDYNARCPLCIAELQQQQREHASRNQQQQQEDPAMPNPLTSPAVSYADPFLWRRLLWQLLGKLSPAAQAFYAQYYCACPHAPHYFIWLGVHHSVSNSLWSPPTADVTAFQLSHDQCMCQGENSQRLGKVKQYVRTLNQANLEHLAPGTPIIAKQVLLSLSALHHCVVPHPSLTHYLPSSNTAAAGKCLQQQLLGRGVLDMFEQQGCRPHMWHVWWHIGIRRYHASRQMHSQQQQWQHQGFSSSSAGVSTGGSSSSIDDMYLDPDARLYAVSFANRQLTGTTTATTSSSQTDSQHEVVKEQLLRSIQQARKQMITEELNLGRYRFGPLAAAVSSTNLAADLQQIEGVVQVLNRRFLPEDVNHVLDAVSQPDDAILGSSADRQLIRQIRSQHASEITAVQQYTGSIPDHFVTAATHQMIRKISERPMFPVALGSAAISGQIGSSNQSADVQGLAEQPDLLSHGPAATAATEINHQIAPDQHLTDVQGLALLSPVPIDALIDQYVWTAWHDEIMQLDHCCDVCGIALALTDTRYTCASCGLHGLSTWTTFFCSEPCLMRHQQQLEPLCKLLKETSARYSMNWIGRFSGISPESGAATIGANFEAAHLLAENCGFDKDSSPACELGYAFKVNLGGFESCQVGVVPPATYIAEAGRLLGDTTVDSVDSWSRWQDLD